MVNIFLVAIGESLGASLRYLAYLLFKSYIFLRTLFVNILGSFIIALLISLVETKNFSSDAIIFFLIIGVLGSFTTFSIFSFESLDLLLSKKFLQVFSYILLLSLSLLFTYLGLNINKLIN